MPDHVHILVEGKNATSDMVKFVAQWKQTTGYLFPHELPRRFWQRRFYDYVLRRAEDSDPIAWYIWMNPVRRGMVGEPQQYLFSLFVHGGMAEENNGRDGLDSSLEGRRGE